MRSAPAKRRPTTQATTHVSVNGDSLRTDRLSFVLPVATSDTGRDGEDLRRMSILLESFLLTFSLPDLYQFFVISPPRDLPAISARLRSRTGDSRFTVVSELDICPELASDPPTWSWCAAPEQRVVPAAADRCSQCCRLAETALSLTFDADIVCVRRFGLQQLLVNGRARCGVETALDYGELYVPAFAAMEQRVKQQRVEWAQRVLGRARPERLRRPLLQRNADAVRHRWRRPPGRGAGGEHTRSRGGRRCSTCCRGRNRPVHFAFLEAEDLYDTKYDCPLHRNAVLRLDESIWQRQACYRDPRNRQLEHWQPPDASDDDSGGILRGLSVFVEQRHGRSRARMAQGERPSGSTLLSHASSYRVTIRPVRMLSSAARTMRRLLTASDMWAPRSRSSWIARRKYACSRSQRP